MAASTETKGLFVTHRGERCGVYQFGVRLFAALSAHQLIRWHYAECADHDEYLEVAERLHPDVVLVNFHPFTMPWASDGLTFPSAMIFSTFHEANQSSLEQAQDLPFDALLCPDPTLSPYDPSFLPVPQFIPRQLPNPVSEPDIFSIGSFGFGTPGKGFDRLCALVNDQFDTALIRINIPPHDSAVMTPKAAMDSIAAACRGNVTKPGIALEITHDFLDEEGLLRFLAGNTINAFLYDQAPGRGISSCTDYALASGRPIAISRTTMFRHLHGVNPSICVEDRSLHAIARSGTAPLRHHCAAYESAAAGKAWNCAILDALRDRREALDVPDGRGFNKILDDRSREAYGPALADLATLAPDMLARKIERANIQQAFVLDTARRLMVKFAEPRILAVGSHEDTAVASLQALGYRIDEVDPEVNGLDLEAFYRAPGAGAAYDLIICTSVLEHVSNDEDFIRMTRELLAPGGIAVFTVDFSNQYPRTGALPAADRQLYTSNDLRHRLASILPDCRLLDAPDWDGGEDDFEYEECRYSFATLVFRKVGPVAAWHLRSTQRPSGEAVWKSLLGEELRMATEQDRERAAAEQRATELAREHERERAVAEQRVVTLSTQFERERAADAQRVASLQQNLATVTDRLNVLLQQLHVEEGPKALRIVLPLARLIRQAHLTLNPTPGRPRSSPPPSSLLPSASSSRMSFAAPGMGRRAALAAYRVIRPVVRPLAWRLRTFLIGDLSEQMRQLRLLHETRPADALPTYIRDEGSAAGEMTRLAVEMERALLTLAMERAKNDSPAGNPAPAGEPDPYLKDSSI